MKRKKARLLVLLLAAPENVDSCADCRSVISQLLPSGELLTGT